MVWYDYQDVNGEAYKRWKLNITHENGNGMSENTDFSEE